MFQECFNIVLFCNFVFAWNSLQLPKQKEGLFDGGGGRGVLLSYLQGARLDLTHGISIPVMLKFRVSYSA